MQKGPSSRYIGKSEQEYVIIISFDKYVIFEDNTDGLF